MYINTQRLEPVTLRQIRKGHPNVSLPRNPTDAHLNPLGYAVLHPTERPEGDVVTEGTPEQGEDGKWYQTWEVRDYTTEEASEALQQAKARKVREINAAYEQELHAVLRDYPDAETKTWDKQESEARAWLADNSAPTPYLDGLATARDLSKSELVARVIAKADAWIALSASATGKRQRLEDEIEAATDMAVLDAIRQRLIHH